MYKSDLVRGVGRGGASEGRKGEVVRERAHLVMISGVWGGVARE